MNEDVDLYPDSARRRPPLERHYKLPARIRRVYAETLRATALDLRVLVGVGIRAIVESVCAAKAADGRNLEHKIDDLVTKGVLPKPNAELLHGTRLLGNKCAHEAEPLTEEGLGAALEVVEHLLTTVFLLEAAGEDLPKRVPR